MIVETFAQGSMEWHDARLGIPTASRFDEILTPHELKRSASSYGYMVRLLSDWLTGTPSDIAASGFMNRGKNLEKEAAAWYAWDREVTVQKVGIILRDDRMVGASPDGLVGDDGLIEIKVPGAAQHVRHMLEGMRGHVGQTQGALWLSGRKWIDLISWHPDLPAQVVRVERSEEYIRALEPAIADFLTLLLARREQLKRMGCEPKRLSIPASAVTVDPF